MGRFAAFLFVAAITAVAQSARGAPADEVRALLEQGRSRDAYELGRRHPGELGKPEFDFYFGVAAVDTGHAGEGVLALERYILSFPGNDQARMELARAYFVLGELVRAREEFETVRRRNPTRDMQATIDRFMDSIRSQETRYRTTATLYVEIGGGYDSNVNSGVRDPFVDVPNFGALQLTQAGTRSGDSFLHLAAGGQISQPVAPGVAIIGGASAEGKLHGDSFDHQFDQTSAAAYAGASYLKDRNLLRATLGLSSLYVDYNRFRQVAALGAEWHVQIDEFDSASLFGQYARIEYPSSPVRDADFYGFGLGWRHAFVGRLRPVFSVQALYGKEQNDAEPARDDLSRNLYTLRGGLSMTPAPRWGASLGLAYTRSRFEEADPLFLVRRDDDYYAVELGVSYRVTRNISFRGDYLHADNRSNIPLYEYSRDVITLRARFEL